MAQYSLLRKRVAWRKQLMKWLKQYRKILFKIHIAHAMAYDDAELLRQNVEKKYPDAEVVLSELGPVIGAH